ncbi:elongation factor P maturation arginine rhamnosyltransferase EarP [Limnobacter sp.]|uniref:elongation factor P maturation arginine rhamnosyltransferase EarP n=1 Tax=Limnobacter sp. TaxID=2003368 RepID=UPI002FE0CDF5
MQIGIVCKVIDNFGDAGFSLRLAKALAAQSHRVVLFHDDPVTFHALYPIDEIAGLSLMDAREANHKLKEFSNLDLIVEPFGTSSEHTMHRFDLELKCVCPQTPWVLIDYLSSEDWVEDFHLSQSIDPSTGHVTTFFYPGFTEKTGGLIHCDYPAHLRNMTTRYSDNDLKVFVFSYPNAPLAELIDCCNKTGTNTRIYIAGSKPAGIEATCVTELAFRPQRDFDDLLAKHDVLFVRGEDSFVRAQLAGRPMIWQIYPTSDGAHADKLGKFFERYSSGLTPDCKKALWDCWVCWNGLNNTHAFSTSWQALQVHLPELQGHALQWQLRLLSGPELVGQLLMWRLLQFPTLSEQTDI